MLYSIGWVTGDPNTNRITFRSKKHFTDGTDAKKTICGTEIPDYYEDGVQIDDGSMSYEDCKKCMKRQ